MACIDASCQSLGPSTSAQPRSSVQQQEPIQALTELVDRACELVDARLKGIVLDKLGFMYHCEAIKKFLFFGQGDFASALMHHTADLLSMRASQVRPVHAYSLPSILRAT